jgi:hypothetical protein
MSAIHPDVAADWVLSLPGVPFVVRAWNNGRWSITSGQSTASQGRPESQVQETAQAAACAAELVLLTWGKMLVGMGPQPDIGSISERLKAAEPVLPRSGAPKGKR